MAEIWRNKNAVMDIPSGVTLDDLYREMDKLRADVNYDTFYLVHDVSLTFSNQKIEEINQHFNKEKTNVKKA